MFRDTSFHSLDLGGSKAGESPLVLGTTESRSYWTLEVSNRSTDRWSAFAMFRHGEGQRKLESARGVVKGKEGRRKW